MKFLLYGHGLDITPEVRASVERTLSSALDSTSQREVRDMTVRLQQPAEVNDLVSCDVAVSLSPSGEVVLSEVAPTAGEAAKRIATGLGSALSAGRARRRMWAGGTGPATGPRRARLEH